VEVQRAELRAHDVPVQLLAEQREVYELDKRGLQLVAGFCALMRAERR
jgi:hypothetical protein